MAENKKGFVLYADQKMIFNDLTNEEAGILIKHIFSYVNDENPVLDNRLIDMAFKPIKLQLKRDLVKYQAVKDRNSANARKRWDAVASSGIPDCTKNADKDKDNDNVKDNDKDINIPFDDFWNLYPKKIAKTKCEPKWNKLDLQVQELILKTLPNFINYKPFESYTHPNPETYFNQERWNDEISVENSTSKKHYYLCSPFGRWDGLLTEDEFKAKTLTGHWTLEKIV